MAPTLAERFSIGLSRRIERLSGRRSYGDELEVWPVRDVSFNLQAGEIVGIIGRNGAGKSTLLKILSRIIDPTEGRAELHGRVGTLLEVGTGFHPELSGRDNVFLNGILLGMSRQEIQVQFDEIVAFSGIGPYLDTPVKRYSSGMYVRLAFAVGAHLSPEILIVDEVLAVGDFEFQHRCLNKMREIGDCGRTVLFVSHDMAAVTRLCPRSILLEKGRLVADGPTTEVVEHYFHSGVHPPGSVEWHERATAPGNEYVRLRAVRVRDQFGKVAPVVEIRESFTIELEYEVLQSGLILAPHFGLSSGRDEQLFLAYEVNQPWDGQPRPVGRYVSRAIIPGNLLSDGTYFVGAFCRTCGSREVDIELYETMVFQIVDTMQPGGARGYVQGRIPGSIRPLLEWTTEREPLFIEDL
ncbi:ABC transporter [Nitrospira sp.]|nr:ABC transporter [Nitrospira sp.]